jgi:hypothetical protein
MTAAPVSASLPTWLTGPPSPAFWLLHIAGAALMVAILVVGTLWRRRRMGPAETADAARPAGTPLRRSASLGGSVLERSFTGGMRYGLLLNWTYPFVTLDMYDSGLELRSTYSFLRFLVPAWRARYEQISSVGWLGRPSPDSLAPMGLRMERGVLFTTANGGWVIFWCLRRNEVLDALARHGLRIDVERKRLTLLGPR